MEQHLKALVNFYPVSDDQASVKRLLEYAQRILSESGLRTRLYEQNGVYNLYAAPTDSKHTRILLQGHVDVVPAQNQSFRVDGDIYRGRGVFDMLFATAAYLTFIQTHKDRLPQLDFGVFLSGDEELSGADGVRYFLEQGYTTDICILPDAGTRMGVLNAAAKGVYCISVKINGKSHHGSRPWEGDGAALKLAHFLTEAEKLFDNSSRDNSTMTVSIVSAGQAENQGPKEAHSTLDIRYKDKHDLERIQTSLNELLQKFNGEITSEHQGDDYQLDLGHPLVERFIKLYEAHCGKNVEIMKAHGSSDARFFSAYNIPVIMLRPEGGGAHGDDEWVSVRELDDFYKIVEQFILEEARIDTGN